MDKTVYSLALPWLFRQLGVERWLRERALHVPDSVLPQAAVLASQYAGEQPTPESWWRAVERAQAQILSTGLQEGVRT